MVQNLNDGNLATLSKALPDTIEKAISQPPVSMLIAATAKESVHAALEFELIVLSTLVSTGGNLTKAQVPFIASQLILQYPNESLADFKLCFQRGASGLYGEIQRLDGVTIGVWFKKYLDEKYQVVEDQLMKQKESLYETRETLSKRIEKAIDVLPLNEAQKYIDEMMAIVSGVESKKIVPMSDDEIRKLGKEKAPKSGYRPYYRQEDKAAHEAWYRKTHPGATPQEVETWLKIIENGK